MTPNLEALWDITPTRMKSCKENENRYFDPVGLNLLREPACWGYWCTPTNTISFASTGGDGVHFGFLSSAETATDNDPIVMTLPTADTNNIVVGENLVDFLSLGCRLGYFDLDNIEYQTEHFLKALDKRSFSKEATSLEVSMLKDISSKFLLEPWKEHERTLEKLRNKYFNKLEFSVEYDEIKS